ncbi:MAG: DUF1275 domain-containing protein [Arthrobacter sp.]|nr:DUF1275 domain-containing protein [Arthrobacter sp.]
MKTVPRVAFVGSVALALLAGFIDAIGFVLSGGLFVSFMSGNSTQSGVEFITGAALKGVVALTLVGGFLSGVVLAQASKRLLPQLGLPLRVTGLGVALLVAAGPVLAWPAPGFALAGVASVMGAMNTLFADEGRARLAITYATGTLVSLGLAIAAKATKQAAASWKRPLAMWAAITLGAGIGATAVSLLGPGSLLIAALVLILIGGTAHTYSRWKPRPSAS